MTDVKVAEAEARHAAHQSAMTTKVEGSVNAAIAGQAAHSSTDEVARMVEVAARLRGKAIDETVHGERRVVRARAAARWSQFMDYGFYVVYALLGIRLVLALIAANSSAGFVVFIRAITGPFYAPFRGIVASPSTEAGNTLAIPIGIALVVYFMLHQGLNALLRMVGHRKTSI